jgi:HAD superfamily phosphoserine phosphatase-like hydrolase
LRSRPFAVFDIDGTLIRWQLYHSLADNMARNGYIPPKDYEKLKEARMVWKRRAKLTSFREYELFVIKQFDVALKQVTLEQLHEAAAEVFEEYKDQAYIYSRGLLIDLKKKGYFLLAVSSSPAEIVKLVADYYAFDDWVGTRHFFKDNRYTGAKRVVAYHKDQALQTLIDKHALKKEGSIGVGDSHSDAAMLKMVEQPIAFNPEMRLYEYASEHGWKIVIERKNMVYELEMKKGIYELAKTNS